MGRGDGGGGGGGGGGANVHTLHGRVVAEDINKRCAGYAGVSYLSEQM